MTDTSNRLQTGSDILRNQAVRIPLPDVETERTCYENMQRIAAAGERKIDLLADPDVPVTEVYEDELEDMQRSFEHRLQQLVGEDYYDVATAYLDGEREDWIGALAAYYLECYYRLQERYTVDDQIFVLVILRYPGCFTVNLSFLTGDVSADAVRYESAKHGATGLDDENREQYYADCQYSQKTAADYLREHIGCIDDAFPDPDTTAFEQRRYGGFVHITGRKGSTFVEILESFTPDPDRFDDDSPKPGLVPAGPEFERVKHQFFDNAEVVI
ncbi:MULTISPECIES: hypothetical protein [Halobacterium]|uniref:hypothetical protein n=1 Tax=Halobacterium TaxID=2239 RepID=UPI00073ECBD8|nr:MULTISPECIES: hypothetical protein [Halobacterium]MCG1003141.1 hypothetical protein [Halobacterium noricense]